MTTFINIFGGPGVGKSTFAASLFSEMKKMRSNVELVTEVAKDFVWEDRTTTLSIQPYITVKQFRNLYRLKNKVDFVITDAPILMGCVYADKYAPNLPESYKKFITDLHKFELNPSLNILLKRSYEYDSNGRYQTEDDAKTIDADIKSVLQLSETEYLERHPNSVMALALELVGEK